MAICVVLRASVVLHDLVKLHSTCGHNTGQVASSIISDPESSKKNRLVTTCDPRMGNGDGNKRLYIIVKILNEERA